MTAVTAGLAACSGSDDEPDRAERLAEIEGRILSEAEIEERAQVAAALCRMTDAVLVELWSQLDNRQLAFQDFVFTQECPERNDLYGRSTGRFTTDDG